MKAIILAAGEGKRLRPLTENKPKALVEIWGSSLLARQLDQLMQLGISDICIITGYHKEQIEKLGIVTVFNSDYNSTNMVYSLSKALPILQESSCENTLVLYGDIAYRSDNLKQLIQATMRSPMLVLGNKDWFKLWSQRLEDPLTDAETFIYDEEFKLQEIGQKPTSIKQIHAQYMGMIKVETSYLIKLLANYAGKVLSPKNKNMYMTELIQQAIDEDNSVRVEIVAGGWIEIDTIEDFKLYSARAPYDFDL